MHGLMREVRFLDLRAATTNNDYTVVPGINFNNLIPGGSMPALCRCGNFLIWSFQKGISYQGLAAYENNFRENYQNNRC